MVLGVGLIAAIATSGCAPATVAFVPLGSHTLRVSADQDADVVWLVKSEGNGNEYKETVYRCHNDASGPICAPAKVPQ